MEKGSRGGVLITGGRGFVGQSVARLLRRHSYRAISVDVMPATDGDEVVADITDLDCLTALFEREAIRAIVHLAAILPTVAQRKPSLATRVNVQGSIHLLELAKAFHVPRFVFGSSLSVYGTWPENVTVSETCRAAPEDLYAAAKLYVEQLGDTYRRLHGMEFVSLRIGRVVGPGARSITSAWRSEIFERMASVDAAEIAIPYVDSERILAVHVEDVATMALELLRAPQLRHTVYNAACESVIVGELKRELERLNPRIRVELGGQAVVGNPRRADWSRLAKEFGLKLVPIFDQLAATAGKAS